jgi:uncharacterized protein YjbI with pentapeptide repeats
MQSLEVLIQLRLGFARHILQKKLAGGEVMVVIIICLGAVLLIWVFAPVVATRRFALATPKEKADTEDNYRKTIGTAIGAIAIIITFAWTFYKDSDTLSQAHAQFANQQFISAATLLKEDSVGPRVAGVSGLRQVATDRDEYRSPVIYATLGFIKSPGSKSPGPNDDHENGWRPIQADIQSAIALLSALDSDHNITVDLDQAYLVRANFSKQPDNNAFAEGSFQGATLYGANFSGVNLTNAQFGGSYMADWESYGKSWRGPGDDYDNTRWLNDVDFRRARLVNANFDHASPAGAFFDNACLAGTGFWISDLSRASFKSASLGKTPSCESANGTAYFYQSVLIDADFEGVDVTDVNFEGSNLTRTHLAKALNVEKARYGGACSDQADFPPMIKLTLPPCPH